MSFEEVLDRAIDMLRRRGRITYRTLKRQFDLDDETREDLAVELIKGQQLAVDEEVRSSFGLPQCQSQPTQLHPHLYIT